jgi:hypothetical protein
LGARQTARGGNYARPCRPTLRPKRQGELGPIREGEDAYERNNRWMLDSALRFGADKVDFFACGTARAVTGRAARAT